MKKIAFIISSVIFLAACKTGHKDLMDSGLVKTYDDGYEVVFFGYNPQDTLLQKYPVSDTDSLEYHYNLDTKQTLIYLLEESRYAVLNENFEFLWYESR